MQRWRRTVQITVLFTFLFMMPLVNLYGNAMSAYRPNFSGDLFSYGAYLSDVIVTENSFAWRLVSFFDGFWGLFTLPAPTLIQWIENFKGAPWTITLFGLTISDPLAVISVFLAEKSVSLIFILSALIPVLIVTTMGRVFCGWICPMSFLLELNLRFRKYLQKSGLPIKNYQFSRHWKFVLLAVFLIMSFSGLQVLTYLLPYVQLGRNAFYWFFYGSLSIGILIVVVIMLLELLLSERGWCRYFCPSGAFLSLLSRYRILRVQHREESCSSGCSTCSRVCNLGLAGKQAGSQSECTNCGQCVSACPQKALSFSFTGKPIASSNNLDKDLI